MHKLFFVGLFAVIAFAPIVSSAHGPVTTQTQTVGDYTIEFEYNTLGTISAGDYTIYNVYLLKGENRTEVDFDSAFLRITKQNGPAVLSGSMAPNSVYKGLASLSGIISEPGTYTADVSFYKNRESLVAGKFDFQVAEGLYGTGVSLSPKSKANNLVIGLVTFVIGLSAGIAIAMWLKNPKNEQGNKK